MAKIWPSDRLFVTLKSNNQIVTHKMKSLDQVNHPAGACASHRTLKLQNKSKFQGSILNELMNFASSVSIAEPGKGIYIL